MIRWYEDKAFKIILILVFMVMSVIFVSTAAKSVQLISKGYFEFFEHAEQRALEDAANEKLFEIREMSQAERGFINAEKSNWYYSIYFNYGTAHSVMEYNIPYYEEAEECYMYEYISPRGDEAEDIYRVYINPKFENEDEFSELHEKIVGMYQSRYIMLVSAVLSGMILVVLVTLLIVSDRRNEEKTSKLMKVFSKLSVDVFALVIVGIITGCVIITDGVLEVCMLKNTGIDLLWLFIDSLMIAVCAGLVLTWVRCAVGLFRKKGVAESFLVYRIGRRLVSGDDSIDGKTSFGLRALCIAILFLLAEAGALVVGWSIDVWSLTSKGTVLAVSIWILIQAVILLIVIRQLRSISELRRSAEKVIESNSSVDIDVDSFSGDLKAVAEALNRLDEGIQLAVDERVKSDRMKIELLTNVSHDLKTPLTSIINYVDLLSKESTTEEEKKEYIDILKTYSQRLKGLIDDLLEASKASTGNLELELIECDVSILLAQAVGEFRDRAAEKKIELVVNEKGEEPVIMADNQHMFRIFENLLTNICKYSLENSRAYLIVDAMPDKVRIEFKNISKAALNISAAELVERFVRGDESRSTEGNGLGLSIAKSLAELQNGTMDIDVNCDMFMVALEFPKTIEEECEEASKADTEVEQAK